MYIYIYIYVYIYIPTVPKITTLDWMALDNTAGLL